MAELFSKHVIWEGDGESFLFFVGFL